MERSPTPHEKLKDLQSCDMGKPNHDCKVFKDQYCFDQSQLSKLCCIKKEPWQPLLQEDQLELLRQHNSEARRITRDMMTSLTDVVTFVNPRSSSSFPISKSVVSPKELFELPCSLATERYSNLII